MEYKEKLPKQIINSSTATLSVSSRHRKKKFARLLRLARTDKASAALWEAIDLYIESKG